MMIFAEQDLGLSPILAVTVISPATLSLDPP